MLNAIYSKTSIAIEWRWGLRSGDMRASFEGGGEVPDDCAGGCLMRTSSDRDDRLKHP